MPILRGRSGDVERGSDFVRYGGLGVQFGATVVLFAFGGWAVDRWAGTSPWFLLVGVGLGFSGGLFSLIRHVPPPRGGRPPDADATTDREPPTP